MKPASPSFAVLFTKVQEILDAEEEVGFSLKDTLEEAVRVKEMEDYLEAATYEPVTTFTRT
jgi:hypothetical protein